ncbi:hypothetical protein [Rugamonas aquatica]|uniref:Outer membrane protein assembly factor BamE n=1 Tax=Rugamonas aquatica TaxID=2743357 RepID=A0A6A7MYU7_9BURK|nr:hypothetical protein [Rugamonas aquatica]MQA37943.1 hypothetical protein [Rugamonas aquatica]
MSRGLTMACLACVAGLLSACAVVAPNIPAAASTSEGLREQLRPGVTTKADVARTLGKGSATRFDNGYEVWIYDDKHAIPELLHWLPVVGNVVSVAEATRSVHELAILFDKDGVVRKYQLREQASTAAQLAGK